jgi:hypothetical protein
MRFLGYDRKTNEVLPGIPNKAKHKAATPATLRDAINVLSQFDYVGRAEDFEAMRAKALEFLGVQNDVKVDDQLVHYKKYLELPDDFNEVVCPYLQGDEALYHHFFPGAKTTCDKLDSTSSGGARPVSGDISIGAEASGTPKTASTQRLRRAL